MNLEKLFELQRKLDEHIEQEHPRQEGEDRLAKKILALLVELGELAQEWRGFKYWSKDQYARTFRVINNKEYNPLLEEYVDCLHFILSIGLELIHRKGIDEIELTEQHEMDNTTDQFLAVMSYVTELWDYGEVDYINMVGTFITLGEMLGFTWEQIEEAYMEKNAINHQRQNNNY
ncbi:dUTP diphosphatase [Thermaerobacillus caldiproteolyticus]|uniref:dUTP diphosphatase n=1 Tax=Thermaerobacillus caldiproteolyticus TaxID=247480 RepID=UPI00188B0A00|nr:dUTP diphosphatase [Anoxybacillus caldiproteolyticus]QPA33437.1 dUTP diphosphatase [Anoxybacillus caldiproteolyticus]